jgi:hypothetical protein
MTQESLPAQLTERLAQHSRDSQPAPKFPRSPLGILRKVLWWFAGLCLLWYVVGGDREKGRAIAGLALAALGTGVSYLIERDWNRPDNSGPH